MQDRLQNKFNAGHSGGMVEVMSDLLDRVELVLPLKPEYVIVARLTASGIASRVGFDIDTIEDIKVSVAEVCNRIVRAGEVLESSYRIIFAIQEHKVVISFHCEGSIFDSIFGNEDDEIGISIINAFMDEVEFRPDSSKVLSMSKAVEGKM